MAYALLIMMFSLAGVPPLAGFFAKFYVFAAAVQAGLYWLAVPGLIDAHAHIELAEALGSDPDAFGYDVPGRREAWTALTLHLDGPHLAANLGAGSWFGYLAARQMGSGTAWFITVTGAALANLLEGLLGPPEHRAVGASTAVFSALGAMSAYSWRER